MAFRIGALKDSTLHARQVGVSRVRMLASPVYLERSGSPTKASELAQHRLLGFTQPDTLNDWPLHDAEGNLVRIVPSIASSSGETLSQMALPDLGIVCLSDFMTHGHRRVDRAFCWHRVGYAPAAKAVYYHNTALAARILCFVDYVIAELKNKPFC